MSEDLLRKLGFRPTVIVSAIVSTYDSEQYIRGCLEDLTSQTLYLQGHVEILVVDCASPGNEEAIVREFQATKPNITYVRITERETLAGAWNIGVKYAEGEFVTNANTDDRHHPECFERMVETLQANENIDLVYADVFRSTVPNQPFHENSQTELYRYKPYFAPEVLMHYQFGCQPMWRPKVHERAGLFDRTLKAASDYSFNYHFAFAGCRAQHIAEPLGSFLERDDSLSLEDPTSVNEQAELRKTFLTPENILRLYQHEGWDVATLEGQVRAFHDIALRALQVYFPWHPGQCFTDAELALLALSAAIERDQNNAVLLNNFAAVLGSLGQEEQAKNLFSQLQARPNLPQEAQQNIANLQKIGTGESLSYQLCRTLQP
jgi:glycosyltransferase involved in cell wall biosynthesis